jgi:hypothetical protein
MNFASSKEILDCRVLKDLKSGRDEKEMIAMLTGRESERHDDIIAKVTVMEEAIKANKNILFASKANAQELALEAEESFLLINSHVYILKRFENNTLDLANPHGKNHLSISLEKASTYFTNFTIN